MRGFLVFLATIAVAAAAGGFDTGLRVRFDVGLFPTAGETYFFDIPKNITEAESEGWKQTRRPKGPLSQLVMYCPSDKVLCAMYDDTGYVAGLQVAVAKLEFSNSEFNWIKRGFTSWNTAVDNECKKFWTLQQYFVDEEFLQTSKEERLAARNSTRLLQAGGVWLTGTDKQLLKVPDQEADIQAEGLFTEQACIPWMGQHYYYNMSSSTECTAEQMYPWFPMTQNGELIATGFMTFGSLELIEGKRDWFERPAELAVRTIVPDGPECLYDIAGSTGTVTMHVYYIDSPWSVTCLFQTNEE